FLDRDAGCARLAHFGLEVEPEAAAGEAATAAPIRREFAISADSAHRYLAPEQLKGEELVESRRVGPATDMFSLGVMAWRLVTGSHPADLDPEDTRGAWRKRLVGGLGELYPDLPEHLVAAIDPCLEPNPGRRLASGAEFL